jgi:hypothetical protein
MGTISKTAGAMHLVVKVALLGLFLMASASPREMPKRLRAYVEGAGFSQMDLAAVERGEAVAVAQKTGEKTEVLIYGVVFINSSVTAFLDLYRDVEQLAGNEGFLAVRKFSEPPRVEDLDGFTFAESDLKDLRTCRPGKCNLQFGEPAIQQVMKLDWRNANVETKANQLLQSRLLEALKLYQADGNRALGTYRNMKYDLNVSATFETLLSRIQGLRERLPHVRAHLLNYPDSSLPNSEEYFYWEKVDFGLKTTLRANHVLIHETDPDVLKGHIVVNKQLWASHYFQSAVDVWLGVEDEAGPSRDGFFLVTVKISRQNALSGVKGSVIRAVAVPRARDGIEMALATFKPQLENQ